MKNHLQNDLTPALSLKKARVDNVGARFIAPGLLIEFHREHISARRTVAGPAVAGRRAVGDTPRRSRAEKVRGQARPAPETFNLRWVLDQIARAA